MAFLQIISDNILPLLVFVAIGYFLDRRFTLDVTSLTKLTFYIVLPSFIFYSIYVAKIDLTMLNVFLMSFVQMFLIGFIAWLAGKMRGMSVAKTEALKNGTMFSNNGNIGIALIALVFGNAPYLIDGEAPLSRRGQRLRDHHARTDEYVPQYLGTLSGRQRKTHPARRTLRRLPYACHLYTGHSLCHQIFRV